MQNHESYFYQITHSLCIFLFSTAPPVAFVDIPEEDLFKSVVEQDQLVLSCEVSRADAIVQWYMDGVEIQPSDNITIQTDGPTRTLRIQSTQLSDMGTYTCRAGDSALMFKVKIRGNNRAPSKL